MEEKAKTNTSKENDRKLTQIPIIKGCLRRFYEFNIHGADKYRFKFQLFWLSYPTCNLQTPENLTSHNFGSFKLRISCQNYQLRMSQTY